LFFISLQIITSTRGAVTYSIFYLAFYFAILLKNQTKAYHSTVAPFSLSQLFGKLSPRRCDAATTGPVDQKDETKRLEIASIISAATGAAFLASLLHVYGLSLALERPLQQFFEPLDYVAIAPSWLVWALGGVLVGCCVGMVTSRAQNFELDEAIAKRAPNPKRSWVFRVLVWKIGDVAMIVSGIPGVALIAFPPLRQLINPALLTLFGIVWVFAVPYIVFQLSGYYLSRPGPRVPESRSIRILVQTVPTFLTLSFATGFFIDSFRMQGDIVVIPWEKILFVNARHKKP
jgi:hypothetical protein